MLTKIHDDFYWDLDDIDGVWTSPFNTSFYLFSKKHGKLNIPSEFATSLRGWIEAKIKEQEKQKELEKYKLRPIEFAPCKDCGKKIPITIPFQGWERSDDVRCWECHEGNLDNVV